MYLRLSLFLLACLTFQTCCPQSPTVALNKDSSQDQTCTVSGIVTRSQDNAPLKNATVQLVNDADREHQIATRTTADGRFELKNVPAGQYKLNVSRNGYVAQELNQKKPGDPGATLTLRPAQRISDLIFKLGRAAVITGKVYDEDGEPVAGVSVRAMRQVYADGRKGFTTTNFQQTNDLGEFRIFGLAPGRYYISAELTSRNRIVGDREFSGSEKSRGEKGYARIYYPSALEVARASSIYVKEGDEIPSVDIFMKEVVVYRVRGKVQYLLPHRGTRDTQLMVMRRGQKIDWDFVGAQEVVKTDNTFQIPELVPGEYTISAQFFDEGKFYSTQEDVDVVNADVDGLTLIIGPGVDIPGHLLWDGKPSLEGERATINLVPDQTGSWAWGGQAHVEETNQFMLKEVQQGTFRITVDGISKDCYIKQIQLGETALPDHVLHVKRGSAGQLAITINSKGARLQGMVVNDESTPVAGVWVVGVPEESKRGLLYLYKSVTTDQYGHYDLRGLAAGKYSIFAWDGVERGEWEDSEFLKTNGVKGVTVEMSDGDVTTADLQVVQLKSKTTQAE